MILPKSAMVFARKYSIALDPNLEQRFHAQNNNAVDRPKITINPRSGIIGKALLHELIHAVDNELGLGLEENDTTRIEGIIATFMLYNPDLCKWIVDRVGHDAGDRDERYTEDLAGCCRS